LLKKIGCTNNDMMRSPGSKAKLPTMDQALSWARVRIEPNRTQSDTSSVDFQSSYNPLQF
jgi:hypothetical protein